MQASACGLASYSISSVAFTRTGTELSVSGPPCTMVQAPPPDDANFSVSCNQGACGTYTLTGSFSDSDHFTGTWHATFGGGCAMCSAQTADVFGSRS